MRSDDFGDLAGAFNEMASRLEGALRAEREMLANVSHELRTPLARIRVVLETAQENPSRAQRLLQEISADLADLERLVEDVMDTVRLDPTGMNAQGTGLRARLVPTDLADLVAEADARFATLHAPRALTLDAPFEGLWVSGDARLLRRLLDNLVDNARKYADGPITLRAARVGERVQVSIEDRGEGIAPDDLARVFTPSSAPTGAAPGARAASGWGSRSRSASPTPTAASCDSTARSAAGPPRCSPSTR